MLSRALSSAATEKFEQCAWRKSKVEAILRVFQSGASTLLATPTFCHNVLGFSESLFVPVL